MGFFTLRKENRELRHKIESLEFQIQSLTTHRDEITRAARRLSEELNIREAQLRHANTQIETLKTRGPALPKFTYEIPTRALRDDELRG